MMKQWMKLPAITALMLALAACSGENGGNTETAGAADSAPAGAADITVVDNIVFPSGVYGTTGSPMEQVDEIVRKSHELLAQQGLGIGNMLQHTIYVKDGAVTPIEVLQRFHGQATTLAPSLKDRPSVGTIVRVPSFPNPDTVVQVDMVAGKPLAGDGDGYKRIKFTFGPQEIVETVGEEEVVFTSGLEAMNFENGTLVESIDEQIDVIAAKLNEAAQKAGLTVGHMVSHNLYVTEGTDPINVIQKFHAATQKYSPGLKEHPSVGTLVIVNGMAVPGFLLEIDAVLATEDPASLKRVPFTEMPMDIVKSVAVGDLIFLAGMEGVDMENGMNVPEDVFEQVEVAVKKIHTALQASGLSIGNMVKHKLYIKEGSGDPEKIIAKFHEVAARLAPELKDKPSAETVVMVEGLAGPQLKFEVNAYAARTK